MSLFASDFLSSSSELTPRYLWSDLARVWVISLGLSVAAGSLPRLEGIQAIATSRVKTRIGRKSDSKYRIRELYKRYLPRAWIV